MECGNTAALDLYEAEQAKRDEAANVYGPKIREHLAQEAIDSGCLGDMVSDRMTEILGFIHSEDFHAAKAIVDAALERYIEKYFATELEEYLE